MSKQKNHFQGGQHGSAQADVSEMPELLFSPQYRRNKLLSLMLQDRSVLRLISAPRGYGKTALAHEYAARFFTGKRILWIDATSPSLLFSLDKGLVPGLEPGADEPSIVVLDDVPWLHEQRAEVLSTCIDAALYRGIEVIATTCPSCDCLRSRQPERVLIRAADLQVSRQECFDIQEGQRGEAKARGIRLWRKATGTLFGRAPALAWGDEEVELELCLKAFFEERLPQALQLAAFSIMILGSGTIDELVALGIALRSEDVTMLVEDYPFLNIDPAQRDFHVPLAKCSLIADTLFGSFLGSDIIDGSSLVVERLLGMLALRGDTSRVQEALDAFCSDDLAGRWLMDRGWDLLDRGEIALVESLFARCPDAYFYENPELQVLRAWCSGFIGDLREAEYYARRVMREVAQRGLSCGDEGFPEDVSLAICWEQCRFALCTFGSVDTDLPQGLQHAFSPVSAGEFLACVIEQCNPVELARAMKRDDLEAMRVLDKRRVAPDPDRVESLLRLLELGEERHKGTREFCFALHLASHVDDTALREQVKRLGCDIVISVRRHGLTSYCDALLVRDMWRSGFFGLTGPAGDIRDARLLDESAKMLKQMAVQRGLETVDIPWESSRDRVMAMRDDGIRLKAGEDVDLMRVRLFGSFEVQVGDHYVQDSNWRRKTRLLIILLVLNQGRDLSRDSIFEHLWPDMPRVRAMDNFYSVWGNMTSMLGDAPYIERCGEYCRVNTRCVVSDVTEFEHLTRRILVDRPTGEELMDIYMRIEAIYKGGLVPSETEDSLVNAQRSRYQSMFVDSMISASACALSTGDARLALWFARKAMEFERGREDVYFALIKAQIAAGQRCSAIRTYFECRKFLQEELGLDPSYDTEELYKKLISTDPSLMRLKPQTFENRQGIL